MYGGWYVPVTGALRVYGGLYEPVTGMLRVYWGLRGCGYAERCIYEGGIAERGWASNGTLYGFI